MNRSRQQETGPTAFLRNFEKIFSGLDGALEKPVADHLRNVYSTVAVGVGAASIGAAIQLYTNFLRAHFVLSLISMFIMYQLISTPNSRENQSKRFGLFLGFCGITGYSIGPLIQIATFVDQTIVTTALLASTVVFGVFSLSAIYAKTPKFLHLGGILATASLGLVISSLFAPLAFILWSGLAISLLFVLYDTQMIIEKRRMGDDDHVWHAVELFIDFANLFRYILILLADNKQQEQRRSNEKKRNE